MLAVDGLQVSYGKLMVVWGVSFHVDQGEVVTIIGSNGAGKTTILRTLAGLLRPSAGRIAFRGREIGGLGAPDVAALGLALVPEGREIFPYMSVHENLLLGGRRLRDSRRVDAGFERVYALFPRLKERRRQVASTLSGGEQQMLAIARALMADPVILLLDEPSTGLAPVVVEYLFDVIRTLSAEGVTTLLVEQNAHLALEVAARAYVLERGRVVLDGTAATLVDHPLVREAYLGLSAASPR
ncbi:MAG: ABC transporter ATP-binding protein [Armatimonadota bacterium]